MRKKPAARGREGGTTAGICGRAGGRGRQIRPPFDHPPRVPVPLTGRLKVLGRARVRRRGNKRFRRAANFSLGRMDGASALSTLVACPVATCVSRLSRAISGVARGRSRNGVADRACADGVIANDLSGSPFFGDEPQLFALLTGAARLFVRLTTSWPGAVTGST